MITLAFCADPVFRFAFPDPSQYLTVMPAVVQAFGGRALDHSSAWCIDGFWGAALWLPPGVGPDNEALIGLMARHMAEDRADMMAEASKRMGASHPEAPHWYLPLIGVDPSRQHAGLGSVLMAHAHELFDRDRVIAYLETSNTRNIPFYQRHGYRLLDTIQVGACPPITAMLREPHTR